MTLTRFKAFEKISVSFRGDAYLVGPNNAGKSTLISALRACSDMIRHAHRRLPDIPVIDHDHQVLAYALTDRRYRLNLTNLRHEFREEETTRLALRLKTGVQLHAVWPPTSSAQGPFFYIADGEEFARSTVDAKRLVDPIGTIPVLTPIDDREQQRDQDYVRSSFDTRLASRHFRNQVALLESEESAGHENRFQEFKSWAAPWLREMTLRDISRNPDGDGHTFLDLYYSEPGRPTPKEIFWSGDGFQVWLQLLLQVFRLKDHSVLVLDEPDVFLHPDLQRRVVQLLDSVQAQVITATHSAELISEAKPESVLWVDKTRRSAVRAPDGARLLQLSKSLGTTFNVALAKALRARLVLFVEGDDMRVLRHVAGTVGAQRIATEAGVAVLKLEGFDRWEHVEPFEWMINAFLEGSVKCWVVLDRDHRDDDACAAVRDRLGALGVRTHVWSRKELESYLLVPEAISRLARAPEASVTKMLDAATGRFEDETRRAYVRRRTDAAKPSDRDAIRRRARRAFDATWATPDGRLQIVPPKDVLRDVNSRLQAAKFKAVTVRGLARGLRASEVPDEMRRLLLRMEEVANEY